MYINQGIKKIIIAVIVIFFILTIAVFQYNKNKNYNEVKQELLTNTWTLEDEYYLKVVKDLQDVNTSIPAIEDEIKKIEDSLNKARLKRRCLEYEMERISTNKWYTINFCDNEENLEQFKLSKQAQTVQVEQPKQVVF